jgi:hypothetical protein
VVVAAMSKPSPFLKTYVLVGVLVALGAYMWFVESKRPKSDEKPKDKVLAFDKTKVKELSLTPKGGPAVQLVKEGEAWKLTAPFAAPADSAEADALIGSLESLEIDKVAAESAGALADFGLEPPRLTVAARVDGASEPMKVLFGDKTPDGTGVYAKLPTQPRVFSIPSYAETAFDKKPFDLRDRDVLHVKRDAVKTLEISGPDPTYALAQADKGEWAFTRPVATKAGRWAVDGLVGSLEGLRMEAVAAENAKDLKKYGLAKPVRSIVIGLKDGTRKTLDIGGSPGEKKYYAHAGDSAIVAVIPSAIVDDLAKGMKELRAKRLLDVATYEVEGFEVEGTGAKRVYERTATKDKDGMETYTWKRTTPEAKELDTNVVQDALFKIGGVEVQEFVDAPAAAAGYGLDAPALKLTVRYKDKPPAWFELGQKSGAAYARRADDTSVLKLDNAKAEEVLKAFKEL